MLKTPIPIYLCSTACILLILSATVPHNRPVVYGSLAVAAIEKEAVIATPKKAKISYSPPNQQALKFVNRYLRNNDHCLAAIRNRSDVPFTIIDSIFTHYKLPLELKYVAVVESELKSTARSHVGAKGPWQLMPRTAHILGLKVNRHADERINYYKSTRAAARYLRDLHAQFGDWLLVLAAYNGGPKPVLKAIHKTHSRDFWILQHHLPAESRTYVKKFIATAYYFEGAPEPNTPVETKKTLPRDSSLVVVAHPNETTDEKFRRLMNESASSLQKSNELMEPEKLISADPSR